MYSAVVVASAECEFGVLQCIRIDCRWTAWTEEMFYIGVFTEFGSL